MRSALLVAPALLAACSTAPASTSAPADQAESTAPAAPAAPATPADSTAPAALVADSPVHGETPGHTCTADGTDQFVGKIRSDELGAEITRVSHAAVLRWAPPGVMLTMDYRADRVTVWLDPSGKITKIRCG